VRTSGEQTIEILRDGAALDALAPAGAEFPQAAANPLLTAEWFGAGLATLHPTSPASLVIVRRGERPVALAPLANAPLAGFTRLELIGARVLHEPAGFLFHDEQALDALCSTLAGLGRPLILQRLPADGAEISAFARAARGRGRLVQLPAAAAPVVRIEGAWEAYAAGLSSRRRQDYRRARRRLEREGTVSVDIRRPTPDTVGEDLAEAMKVEGAGWKQQRGTALLHNAPLAAFFREMAGRLARQGNLRIAFLRLNGEAIATQVCIEHAERWWVLKIGYDERWAAMSPGIQLMWDVMSHAFERRLRSVELLGTAEEWLNIWSREEHAFRTLVFYPYRPLGLAALGVDALGALARRLRRPASP
jgi:CelD/BcsL family acetyltransferase involved in cellulose biosynthesis